MLRLQTSSERYGAIVRNIARSEVMSVDSLASSHCGTESGQSGYHMGENMTV